MSTGVVQKPFAIIVFLTDNLNSEALTASRIYEGGADHRLNIEKLPHPRIAHDTLRRLRRERCGVGHHRRGHGPESQQPLRRSEQRGQAAEDDRRSRPRARPFGRPRFQRVPHRHGARGLLCEDRRSARQSRDRAPDGRQGELRRAPRRRRGGPCFPSTRTDSGRTAAT